VTRDTRLTGFRRVESSCEGVGGIRLHTVAWEIDRPRCAILVVHGHGEHSGRYEDFAECMAERGCSVYAFDQRGHGRSEGRRGHARSMDVLLQDVDRVRNHVAGLAGAGVPLVLLGQSMGGLIGLRYQQEFAPPVNGLVLVAPWLATAMKVPRWKSLATPLLSRLLPALPFRTRLDPEHLSRDPAEVAAYRDDPLVHDTITPRLFSEIAMAMGQAPVRAERLRVPVLLVVGDDDPIVDTPRSLAFVRSLSTVDVSILCYRGLRHAPLHEPERGRVIRDIAAWLDGRLPPAVPNRQP
jgi:alpha-beta hydrolase superfamily lysophospholipase